MPPVAGAQRLAGAKRANAGTKTKNPTWRLSPGRRPSSRQLMDHKKEKRLKKNSSTASAQNLYFFKNEIKKRLAEPNRTTPKTATGII